MRRNTYDAAIIGSGIGGLVCGNYLAKAGKKVLILEKNGFPGGCCSSFIKDGFFFDSGAHFINGEIMGVLRDLGIYNKNDYIRLDPIAVFCLGGKKYFLKNDFKECIRYLKSQFPKEDIDRVFSLMEKGYIFLHYKFKDETFYEFLNRHFNNFKIKTIFYALIFSMGTPPEKISAAIALKILKSIFTYGLYYPKGGMQAVSDKLANNLYKYNGKLFFRHEVRNILMNKANAHGLLGANDEMFFADRIIANISPINVLGSLIKTTKLTRGINKRISGMELCDSIFAVHIALKKKIGLFCKKTFYCYSNSDSYKRKNAELYFLKSPFYKPSGFICALNGNFNNKEIKKSYSLNLIMPIYYKPKEFWDGCKEKIANAMISDMENISLGFKENILFKKITTPPDIALYTGNNEGSMGGWAMTPSQIRLKSLIYKNGIRGLYFAGHWTYPGGGISNAAISGRNVAKLILNSGKC